VKAHIYSVEAGEWAITCINTDVHGNMTLHDETSPCVTAEPMRWLEYLRTIRDLTKGRRWV
jgi:hypothetical protein